MSDPPNRQRTPQSTSRPKLAARGKKRRPQNGRQPAQRRPPALPEPGPDAPYWLPKGKSWTELPAAVQSAVHQVLIPLWCQLIRESDSEFGRSVAISFVHIVWLELCDHTNIGEFVGNRDTLWSRITDPDSMIKKHLRLLDAKNRTAQLLARLRFAEKALAQLQSSASPPKMSALVNPSAWSRFIPQISQSSPLPTVETAEPFTARETPQR